MSFTIMLMKMLGFIKKRLICCMTRTYQGVNSWQAKKFSYTIHVFDYFHVKYVQGGQDCSKSRKSTLMEQWRFILKRKASSKSMGRD